MGHRIWAGVLVAPALIAFAAFTLYPLVASIGLAFVEWDGSGSDITPVGFDNFAWVLKDPWFWNAAGHTLVYTFMILAVQIPVALVLAAILSSRLVLGSRILRTLFFLPIATPTAVTAAVLSMIFVLGGTKIGVALVRLGVLDRPIDWLGDPATAFWIVTAVGIWLGLGYPLIFFLAGMRTIDQDVIDAARLDGAGPLAILRNVVLPQLRPVIALVVLTTALHSIRVFDSVQVMTRGGPYYATDVVGTYIFRLAFPNPTDEFSDARIGLASAAALLVSVLVVVISVAQFSVRGVLKRGSLGGSER